MRKVLADDTGRSKVHVAADRSVIVIAAISPNIDSQTTRLLLLT